MYLIGEVSVEEQQHAAECAVCQAEIVRLENSLSHFRGAVRHCSDQRNVNDRVPEVHWTLIPASDPLKRLLLPASLDTLWYRSL
jgi:hypothetical protein